MNASRCLILLLGLLWSAALSWAAEANAVAGRPRIAIIKADDFTTPSPAWDRFLQITQNKGVKVSIGVIGHGWNGLKDPKGLQWIRNWATSGQVEFWNHGWDHKWWTDPNKNIVTEFKGTGYDHQKEHIIQTQAVAKSLIGAPFVTFGSPFNSMDSDTIRVLNETPELELIFVTSSRGDSLKLQGKTLILLTALRGEADGAGKPDREKFQAAYAKVAANLSVTAVQFHPGHYDDAQLKHCVAIIDFLKEQGWTFMLPSEYLKHVKAVTKGGQ